MVSDYSEQSEIKYNEKFNYCSYRKRANDKKAA